MICPCFHHNLCSAAWLAARCVVLVLCLLLANITQASARKKKDHRTEKVTATVDMPEPDIMPMLPRKGRAMVAQHKVGEINHVVLHNCEGIDVSHYQGTIDWPTVVNETGISYAFIKATEGDSRVDEYYQRNIKEARRAGLKVGAYHFFRANVNVDSQVSHLLSVIKPSDIDFVPMIDVELNNRVGHSQLVERLHQLLEKVTQAFGKRPMIYTYVNFYNKFLVNQGFEEYPMMIAFYHDAPPELYDGRTFCMWQYTSKGEVPGIRGYVDRSCVIEDANVKEAMLR